MLRSRPPHLHSIPRHPATDRTSHIAARRRVICVPHRPVNRQRQGADGAARRSERTEVAPAACGGDVWRRHDPFVAYEEEASGRQECAQAHTVPFTRV